MFLVFGARSARLVAAYCWMLCKLFPDVGCRLRREVPAFDLACKIAFIERDWWTALQVAHFGQDGLTADPNVILVREMKSLVRRSSGRDGKRRFVLASPQRLLPRPGSSRSSPLRVGQRESGPSSRFQAKAVLRSAAMAEEEGNAFQLACHLLGLGMTAAAGARLAESDIAARRGADEAQRIRDPIIELWGRAQQATSALSLGRFAHLDEVADQIEQTGKPLAPVVEMATGLLRRIAKSIDQPDDVAGLLELGELLRSTFVPNEDCG